MVFLVRPCHFCSNRGVDQGGEASVFGCQVRKWRGLGHHLFDCVESDCDCVSTCQFHVVQQGFGTVKKERGKKNVLNFFAAFFGCSKGH